MAASQKRLPVLRSEQRGPAPVCSGAATSAFPLSRAFKSLADKGGEVYRQENPRLYDEMRVLGHLESPSALRAERAYLMATGAVPPQGEGKVPISKKIVAEEWQAVRQRRAPKCGPRVLPGTSRPELAPSLTQIAGSITYFCQRWILFNLLGDLPVQLLLHVPAPPRDCDRYRGNNDRADEANCSNRGHSPASKKDVQAERSVASVLLPCLSRASVQVLFHSRQAHPHGCTASLPRQASFSLKLAGARRAATVSLPYCCINRESQAAF